MYVGEEDIFDLVDALTPVATKWKAIGTALRLKYSKLEELESNNRDDVHGCLLGTVAEYVHMSYDTVKHGEPTWLKVVKTVEHPAGGNNRAHAITIAKEHLKKCKINKVKLDSIITNFIHIQ